MWSEPVYFILLACVVGLQLNNELSKLCLVATTQEHFFIALTADCDKHGFSNNKHKNESLFSMVVPKSNISFKNFDTSELLYTSEQFNDNCTKNIQKPFMKKLIHGNSRHRRSLVASVSDTSDFITNSSQNVNVDIDHKKLSLKKQKKPREERERKEQLKQERRERRKQYRRKRKKLRNREREKLRNQHAKERRERKKQRRILRKQRLQERQQIHKENMSISQDK